MAKVVQRRTSPPYLLIIFVFLFLIAAALAVLLYVQNGDVTAQYNKAQTKLALLGTDDQIQRAEAVFKAYNKAQSETPGTHAEPSRTALGFLEDRTNMLYQVIMGQLPDNPIQLAQLPETLEKKGITGSLIRHIENVDTQISELRKANLDQKSERDQAVKAMEQALDAAKTQQEAFDAQVKAITDKTDESAKDAQAAADKQKATFDEIRKQLTDTIAQGQATDKTAKRKFDDLSRKYDATLVENETLRSELGKARPQSSPDAMTKLVKGKVGQVVDKVVYIDRGAKDKVTAGMTFTVYPPGNIPEDGKGKGTIIVRSVNSNISECAITSQKPSNPILVGDVIGNVAYNPTRVYTFAIRGSFNLHGNKPTPEGADEIKEMIRHNGGKVVDNVTVQTDFLVLGEAPPVPKQSEDATPAEQATYQEQLKANAEYDNAVTQARADRVSMLDVNKFLTLIGYSPEKP